MAMVPRKAEARTETAKRVIPLREIVVRAES
jgi:hypothetical protein